MEKRIGQPAHDSQKAARALKRYLQMGRVNKEAARKYARVSETGFPKRQARKQGLAYLQANHDGSFNDVAITDPKEREKIDSIRQEILDRQEALPTDEKDISVKERVIYLFQAKSKRRSGISEEQRVEMYTEAGCTPLQIQGLTGKQRLSALAATGVLSGASESVRVVATIHPDLIPYLDHLSGRSGTLASTAAIGLYGLSYGLFAWQNLRYARAGFASGNTFLTEMYLGGDMLFPNRIRDLIAWGGPVGATLFTHGAVLTAAIEGTTGNTKSVIAGNLVSALVNFVYFAGGEFMLNRKMRRRSNSQP